MASSRHFFLFQILYRLGTSACFLKLYFWCRIKNIGFRPGEAMCADVEFRIWCAGAGALKVDVAREA